MIYGVSAQPIAGSIIESGGTFPGSLAAADFVNGVYEIAGVSTTAAAIIDKPGQIDGSGLRIDAGANEAVAFIGDFLQAFADTLGFYTVVIEWDIDATGTTPDVLIVQEADIDFGDYMELWSQNPRTSMFVIDSWDSGEVDSEFSGLTDNANVMRLAYTRDTDRVSISINGASAVVNSYATTELLPASVTLGGYPGGFGWPDPVFNGYVRQVLLYPVKSDAILPTL